MNHETEHAAAHAAQSERAVSLELEREVCGVRPATKRSARVPRDTEPCNLVAFLGFVAGVSTALALAGWATGALLGAGLQWLGVR
ncbi:hypothetical protein [Zoogloea sp.]|uniref:hypothetical protein n=1 Tax=Zoogloea sp. TaxID=49181 RepID=UPI002623ABA7|nr:hypothetical protein [Zoogloea sp.]MDD3355272.1 hypothetical protein [Zoogloea sp.]